MIRSTVVPLARVLTATALSALLVLLAAEQAAPQWYDARDWYGDLYDADIYDDSLYGNRFDDAYPGYYDPYDELYEGYYDAGLYSDYYETDRFDDDWPAEYYEDYGDYYEEYGDYYEDYTDYYEDYYEPYGGRYRGYRPYAAGYAPYARYYTDDWFDAEPDFDDWYGY